MNTTSRNYTILSIGVMAIAIVAVVSFAYLSRPQVSADVESQPQTTFYSVKKGWNYFTAGNQVIDEDSRIISINKNLISIADARKSGIVGEINLIKDGKIVSSNVKIVTAGQRFGILVEDITLNPQIYLGE